MAKPGDTPDPLLERLANARNDRAIFAPRINRFYELALPHRNLVSSDSRTPRDPGEQDDVFDATLQDALDDFAADMLDEFTPHYKSWVQISPGRKLKNSGEEKQWKEGLKKFEEALYDGIRASNFYQESQECWTEVAGSATGMLIPYAPPGQQIRVEPIMMANLLMDRGPNGELDGRFYEYTLEKRHLRAAFPGISFEKYPGLKKEECKDATEAVTVVQGCYRDYNSIKPVWNFCIYVNDQKVHTKALRGDGAHPIVAMRWRVAPPSAWGPGPALKSVAPGGGLNELHYLILKHLGKQVDTPMVYDEDGVFNPEAGINAGESHPRMKGSTFDWLIQEQDLQVAFFERENMERAVKRPLYQDKPHQSGDTPPTAGQWFDEKATNARRLQLPRPRVYEEWDIAVLKRFAWILARRGELPAIEIGGEGPIAVNYINPASRASDMEEVTRAGHFLTMSASALGEQALASIDAFQTMQNIQEKLGDKLVVLKEPSLQDEFIKQLMTNGAKNAAAGKAGAAVGGPQGPKA